MSFSVSDSSSPVFPLEPSFPAGTCRTVPSTPSPPTVFIAPVFSIFFYSPFVLRARFSVYMPHLGSCLFCFLNLFFFLAEASFPFFAVALPFLFDQHLRRSCLQHSFRSHQSGTLRDFPSACLLTLFSSFCWPRSP